MVEDGHQLEHDLVVVCCCVSGAFLDSSGKFGVFLYFFGGFKRSHLLLGLAGSVSIITRRWILQP